MFLNERRIETEEQLRAWLENEANRPALLKVRGVKSKTADYLKILVGLQTVAPDRHIFAFLREAGIHIADDEYERARSIVNAAADVLRVKRACLDHSIWLYKSRSGPPKCSGD
jgi:thermostable 8-oxoguanine DNA glycosylase